MSWRNYDGGLGNALATTAFFRFPPVSDIDHILVRGFVRVELSCCFFSKAKYTPFLRQFITIGYRGNLGRSHRRSLYETGRALLAY